MRALVGWLSPGGGGPAASPSPTSTKQPEQTYGMLSTPSTHCRALVGEEESSSEDEGGAGGRKASGSEGSSDEEGHDYDDDAGLDMVRRLEDLSEDDLDDNDWEAAERQQELEDQLE